MYCHTNTVTTKKETLLLLFPVGSISGQFLFTGELKYWQIQVAIASVYTEFKANEATQVQLKYKKTRCNFNPEW